MRLVEIAEVTGGRVHDDPGDVVVTAAASVDSRAVEQGGLFVAFVGEHADGHDYAAAAVSAGAAAVLASRPVGVPAVVVGDVQEALGAVARHVLAGLRAQPDPCRVVGLTGSQGKTTTKDLLAAVLGGAGSTVATQGSFNNEIGLPLTVLRADTSTRFLVLEMGARGPGHLRALCAIAPPDVALVLNVGRAHIGEFGSQDGIAAAKGELVEALAADGVAVLNADDHRVDAMASRTRAAVVRFGTSDAADVRLRRLRLDAAGRAVFELVHQDREAQVALQLVGEHQALNATAAAATAFVLGVALREAASRLSSVTSLSRWRMEVSQRADGVTVVNDAYNANPDSMAAALASLVAIGRGRGAGARTIAVLGEMRELGESSEAEHEAVGRLVARLKVDRLLVVGDAARAIQVGALAETARLSAGPGSPGPSAGEEPVVVPDNPAAVEWLRGEVRPGDVVLVKASRGSRLDVVAQALLEAGADR